jgi:hypothetical protein
MVPNEISFIYSLVAAYIYVNTVVFVIHAFCRSGASKSRAGHDTVAANVWAGMEEAAWTLSRAEFKGQELPRPDIPSAANCFRAF